MDLHALTGAWQGHWRTWVEPEVLYSESDVAAEAEVLYEGRSALLRYSAELDGPVHGVALIGRTQSGAFVAWQDTWHTGGLIMPGTGTEGPDEIEVSLPYVGEGETWQWSTRYALLDDRLVIRHHNEGPDQPRYLGVEMVLER